MGVVSAPLRVGKNRCADNRGASIDHSIIKLAADKKLRKSFTSTDFAMRAELRHNLNQSAFSKFSVLVAVGLVVVLSIFAFGIFYLSRVTASDAEGAYWADSSKVSVTPAGYATNATGQLSAILAITNSGPYTFAYDGHIETFNGKHWVDFPSGNLYVYTPATSLLNPGSSATLLVPAPSPNIKWRAKLDVRDVHGKGPVAWLTRVWEDCVKKDHKMGCVYSEE